MSILVSLGFIFWRMFLIYYCSIKKWWIKQNKNRNKLQSNQVKRTPQDSISELIIWKMNPLVVPVTGVKFKAAFLHA